MFVNSGTRGNKIGVMRSLSVSPPFTRFHKTRDTPRRVKQGGSKKSYGINNWHSLRKGEKATRKEKSGKGSRVIEWWRRESIFGKRCCKKAGTPSGKEKEDWKGFFKSWMPGTFVKGNCFGTPLYTTCKSEQGWR